MKIPDNITRSQILAALVDLDRNIEHYFADSTGYDVLHEGRRYPPKAVVGVAAGKVLGTQFGPNDFKGGLRSKCFRILEKNDFTIVTKGEKKPFPDEIAPDEVYAEGSVKKVAVNKYERDRKARAASIKHNGHCCLVCGINFALVYGAIGEEFIHVHHLIPLSEIGKSYKVNPKNDLKPVCPNCHAMLHKRSPPFTIEELRQIIEAVKQR